MVLFPDTNILEALRLMLGLSMAFLAGWAFMRRTDGSLAFAGPIRRRVLKRRLVQTIVFIVAGLLFTGHGMLSALSPDPPGLSLIPGNAFIIVIETLFNGLLMYFIRKWGESEFILAGRELSPSAERKLEEAIEVANEMARIAAKELIGARIALEQLVLMPDPSKRDVQEAMDRLISATLRVRKLQERIIDLTPAIPTILEMPEENK